APGGALVRALRRAPLSRQGRQLHRHHVPGVEREARGPCRQRRDPDTDVHRRPGGPDPRARARGTAGPVSRDQPGELLLVRVRARRLRPGPDRDPPRAVVGQGHGLPRPTSLLLGARERRPRRRGTRSHAAVARGPGGLHGSSPGERGPALMRRHAWRGGRAAVVELSVIVPCYDEEGNLPELVERTARVFEQRSIAGEIVLVNDGSRDGTAAQIDDLARRRPDVVAVHHATNLGIPAGWRSGFERSRGRYVCTIDADLQYQPEAIAVLHREMCAGRADVVQGWRSPFERRRDHRYFLSRGLDVLLKLTFALPGRDVKSGFVLCRREVFEDVLSDASRFHYFPHMIPVVAKARGDSLRQVAQLLQ